MNVEHLKTESTLALVREKLAQQLCERSSYTVENIEVLETFRRPYSTTTFLAASTDSGTHRFVLKEIVKHPLNASIFDGPQRSSVEYDILTQLYPKFATIQRCFVPQPVIVLPEIDAFIMEHVAGHILADDLKFVHYLANHSMFQQLQVHFYDSGKWLNHFQEFTGVRFAGKSALDNILVRCDDRLRVIEESRDQRCPEDFRKIAMDYVVKQVDRLASTKILVTGRHGDFGPWNMLASPDGVTVIDFFNYCEDPLPVDIVGVLVYLESISHGLANSKYRINTLRDHFLAGLGPIPQLPPPLVLLCEAMQRIRSIAGAVIIRTGVASLDPIGLPERWERSRSLRSNVNWFLAPQEESLLWPE